MSKRIIFSGIILILSITYSLGQSKSSRTDSIVDSLINQIAKDNIYESYTVGYAGLISKQYQRFEQLLTIATEQRLFDLAAHHKNAVVRLYAFQALKKKGAKIPESLIEKFNNDHSKVIALSGCFGDFKSVSALATTTITQNGF